MCKILIPGDLYIKSLESVGCSDVLETQKSCDVRSPSFDPYLYCNELREINL